MEFKEQLRSAVDIVKVIGEYVRLKRQGSTGRYLGLCPFHQEKTPSFNVNQTRQFYKCFGCDASGDVFKFMMELEGCTFPEVLKLLAERFGIPMPQRAEYGDVQSKLRGALFEMHAIAAGLFQDSLRGPGGGEARAYLAKRGISAELIETFGLGYSESSGQVLMRRLAQGQFTAEQLDASGLAFKRDDGSHYDAFRGRLMFPIHDESGKVIAFGGRALREDDQPKYRNSSETPIYRKSSVLYNLHRARDGMRKSNRAILVEGYMDVIGVYAAGIKEVVASCGTSLTAAQVGVMHRHSDTVVINFDPDNAGVNAAEKAIHLLLDEGLHVRVLALDGGLDPDEYVKQNGAELYRARLDSASGYFHWLADRARIKYDMSSVDGRMDAFKLLLMPAVQKLSDRLERAAVVNDLAGYLGVDKGEVLDQFKKAAADRRAPAAVSAASRVEIPALERILFNALLISAAVRDDVLPRLDQAALDGFVTREIFETLKNLVNSGGQVGFSALNERLTGAAQGLLHDLTTADEILDEEDARAKADACMRRLESERRKRHLAGLKARVAAAQREGQTEEARSLAMELMRAENTAHQGGSSKW